MSPAEPRPDAPPRAPGGWRLWIVTVGGSGLSPVAPGTAGSLVTTLLLAAVFAVMTRASGKPPGATEWNLILSAGILLFSMLCVGLGPWTAKYFARKDPGPCVLDEAAGICLTALFLPINPGWGQVWTLATAFAAFRLFDVLKPWPANRLEKLPEGWGILTDDLMAAVYANVVCQVVLRFVFA